MNRNNRAHTYAVYIVGAITLFLGFYLFHTISQKVTPAPTENNYTFAMIKPDAIAAKNSGKIIDMIEYNNFTIVGMKKLTMDKKTAEQFYAEHAGKPFYNDLIAFITSGPVIVMALEKENAVQAWRDLIGSTDPAQAATNTIRKIFGSSKSNNAVHGSDSAANALREIEIFFPKLVN